MEILELTEFRWTINDVLQQPEPELAVVFDLKAIGEKMRSQARKERINRESQ